MFDEGEKKLKSIWDLEANCNFFFFQISTIDFKKSKQIGDEEGEKHLPERRAGDRESEATALAADEQRRKILGLLGWVSFGFPHPLLAGKGSFLWFAFYFSFAPDVLIISDAR